MDGVFPVMVSDNASSLVSEAGTYLTRLTEGFLAYSQARGLVFDPTRPADPTGKRVERSVPFVRQSFWAGESFVDLEAAQRGGGVCRTAGERVHGTTRRRPAEVFAGEEQRRCSRCRPSRMTRRGSASPRCGATATSPSTRCFYSVPEATSAK
ncbi:MAG: hypothetical protein R3F65_29810 [bacterium]